MTRITPVDICINCKEEMEGCTWTDESRRYHELIETVMEKHPLCESCAFRFSKTKYFLDRIGVNKVKEQPLSEKIERFPILLNGLPMKNTYQLGATQKNIQQAIQNTLKELYEEIRDNSQIADDKDGEDIFCIRDDTLKKVIDTTFKKYIGESLL